ncbi:MAG: methyltransferase domain-containing protein [Planctomycetota bacterium]
MNDSQGVADRPSADLFWEPISERRWGRYISASEHASLLQAHELAGSSATALEIGAEGGRWSKILADLGWQMVCTDIVADALDVCQRRIPSAKCVLVDRDAEDFPCDDVSIRLLLAIEVHELVEQDWFIDESARVLEQSGLFVGVFQNKHSWRAFIRNLKRDPEDSFQQYTAAYAPWRKKLVNRGFRMIREEGLCWMPFGRMSDSPLIPSAVRLEKALGLRRIARWSPWIVFVAQKVN